MSINVDSVLSLCKKWEGQRNSIVDVYNSHKPWPRGYKVTYQDALCATYVSALFIELDATDIVPPECGAMQLMRNMDALGRYYERDKISPTPGDLIFFEWQGDAWVDHVGLVTAVKENSVVYSHIPSYSVRTNEIKKSSSNIRGYARPEYDTNATSATPELETPSGEFAVGDLATVKNGSSWYNGYNIPRYVFDLTWNVIAVKGDRVVLGTDTTGRYNIQSPIHATDLKKIKKSASSNSNNENTSSDSSITDMARAVIRGEYGNGLVRRIKLGKYYDAVQKEVNRLLNK